MDANMRELAATGWMSNRGRQNVASLVTKDLGIDWRWGGWLGGGALEGGGGWGNLKRRDR